MAMKKFIKCKVVEGAVEGDKYVATSKHYNGDGFYFWPNGANGYDLMMYRAGNINLLWSGIEETLVHWLSEDYTEPVALEAGLEPIDEVISERLFLKALAVVTDSAAGPSTLKALENGGK